MADGSIRIDTRINKKGAEQGLEELKKTADDKVKQLEKGISQAEKEVEKLNSKFADTTRELESVQNQMDIVGDRVFETYKDFQGHMSEQNFNDFIQSQIEADSQYKKLISKQEQLKFKAEEYQGKLKNAKSNQEQLNSSLEIAKQEQVQATKKLDESQKKAKKLAENLKKAKNESTGLKTSHLGISDSIGKSVKQLLKYGVALLGINTIYQGLKSSANAWLNSGAEGTEQLKSNIDSITVAIGSGLQPVIQAVYNLVIKLLGVVASLIKTFTGINIFANATTKNLTNATSSAKDLNNELSSVGFDEQEKLQDNSSSSSGSGDVSPTIDYTTLANQFTEFAEKVKAILEKILEPFKKAWETTGQEVIDAWYNALNGIKSLITAVGKSFEEIWTNGTIQTTAELLLKIVADILNIIGNIARAFANAWNEAGKGTAIVQSLANALNNILSIVESILRTFAEWWKTDTAQAFANAIISIFQIISSWIEKITAKLKEVWDNGGQYAFTQLLDIGSKVVQIFEKVMEALDPIVTAIIDLAGNVLSGLLTAIGKVLEILNNVADWLLENDGVIKGITYTVLAFMAAWEVTKLLAFIQTSGGVVAVLKNVVTAIAACTTAKIADKLETIQLTAMYAGDFLKSIGSAIVKIGEETAAWIAEKAAKVASVAVDVAGHIKDFIVNLVNAVIQIGAETAAWIAETAAKVASTVAQVALTAATTAWNVICVVATAVTTALGVAINFLCSPIGLVIIAIVALIAIIVLLVNNWDTVSAALSEGWEWLKEKAIEIFTAIGEFFSNIWESIKETAVNIWNSIKDFLSNLWESITTTITNVWNVIFDFFKNIFESIKNAVSTAFENIKTIITNVLNAIKDIWNTIWTAIKTITSTIWNAIYSTISTIFNNIKTSVSNIFNSIKSTITTIWNGIKSTITSIVNGIYSGVSSVFNNLKNTVVNIFNAIKNAITNVFNSIWNTIRSVANSILGGIESMINGVIRGINGMIGALNRLSFTIPDWVPGLGGKTLGFNISTIGMVSLPRLAKGGIAMQPTQAIIGEAGKEAILPLENNTEWMEDWAEIVAEKIKEILEELGFSDNDDSPINIYLDSEVIQRILNKRNKKKILATNGRC